MSIPTVTHKSGKVIGVFTTFTYTSDFKFTPQPRPIVLNHITNVEPNNYDHENSTIIWTGMDGYYVSESVHDIRQLLYTHLHNTNNDDEDDGA